VGQFQHDGFELGAVVGDEFGGHNHQPAAGIAPKRLKAGVKYGQQLARKRLRRCQQNRLVDELNAHFGRVGNDHLQVGAARKRQDVGPLAFGREHAADAGAHHVFFHGLAVDHAAHGHGVQAVLAPEGRKVATVGAFHHHHAAVEDALAVGLVNQEIGQAAQQHAGAELQHLFGQGKQGSGRPGYRCGARRWRQRQGLG